MHAEIMHGLFTFPGFIPLVKMGIAILAGYYLTKKGLFPPEASKGASHLAMVSVYQIGFD